MAQRHPQMGLQSEEEMERCAKAWCRRPSRWCALKFGAGDWRWDVGL